MMSTSLWGDLESVEPIRTPTSILKEQATALSDATNGVLRGTVSIEHTVSGLFELELSIIAPALNDYGFSVAVVKHPLELYPARVWPAWERYDQGKGTKCETEEEYLMALKGILGSATVRTVIRSLISQSKS